MSPPRAPADSLFYALHEEQAPHLPERSQDGASHSHRKALLHLIECRESDAATAGEQTSRGCISESTTLGQSQPRHMHINKELSRNALHAVPSFLFWRSGPLPRQGDLEQHTVDDRAAELLRTRPRPEEHLGKHGERVSGHDNVPETY